MPKVKPNSGGRGTPRPADFLDCAQARSMGLSVTPLTTDPGDADSFARELEGVAELCTYPQGSPHRFGYFFEDAKEIGDEVAAEATSPDDGPKERPQATSKSGSLSLSDVPLWAKVAAGASALVVKGLAVLYGMHRLKKRARSGRANDLPLPLDHRDTLHELDLGDDRPIFKDDDPFRETEPAPQPRPAPDSAPESRPGFKAPAPARAVRPVPRPRWEDPSGSVTTAWDGSLPESVQEQRLFDGFDWDEDEVQDRSEQDNRTTLPAPAPDDRVLAQLGDREAAWIPFASRPAGTDADLAHISALIQLAYQMGEMRLYADLSEEELQRRAEYHYENWRAVPDSRKRELLKDVRPEEAIRSGFELVMPHSWLVRQEARLNARLRLSENPVYAKLPDESSGAVVVLSERASSLSDPRMKYARLGISDFDRRFPGKVKWPVLKDGETEDPVRIVHDGPGRSVLRSAAAMVSNYTHEGDRFGELTEAVFSSEGLERVLITHAKVSPIKRLAERLSRLLEFSHMGLGKLELVAKRYLKNWQEMGRAQRADIVIEDLAERGAVYLAPREGDSEEERRAIREFGSKHGVSVLWEPVAATGGAARAAVDEPPDSWLRLQRRESNAWSMALRAAGEAVAGEKPGTDFSARHVHRQLYHPSNENFMALLPSDRYHVCKHVANTMEGLRGDAEFMAAMVSKRGYISPEGVARIMSMSGVADSRMRVDLRRSRGLRMRRVRRTADQRDWIRDVSRHIK